MKPEVYFIKYAFPCAHILYKVRGEVSKDEFSQLKEAALNNLALERSFLERIFFRAFKRIEKIAEEMGKDKWDYRVIEEYFKVRHNKALDNSDYPESFKEMCKIFKSEVLADLGKEVIVKYTNREERKRRVSKDYFPELSVGDNVLIHWNYAVEKI